MRKGLWGVLAGALVLAGAVGAADKDSKASQIEASMLVSGELSVDATGAVTSYTLDQAEKLPPGVKDLLATALPTFRFEPEVRDGKAQPVRAKMTLQLVAHRLDHDNFELRLRSARFTDKAESDDPSAVASIAQRPRMHYPEAAVMAGVSGTVYLALRFDHTGHVTDVDVSQINLRVDAAPMQLAHWRTMFARSAMADARKIVLFPPRSGPHAGDASFTGILPLTYLWGDQRPAAYGEWDSYVRGPVKDIAWMHGDEDASANGETVPDGEFAMGTGMHLLTPLGGS